MGRTTSGTEHSVLEDGGNRCTLSGSRQPTHRAAARHATGRDSAPRPSAVVDLRPSSPNQHSSTTTTAAASQHSLPPARTMNDPTQQREGHMERRDATRRGSTLRCAHPTRPARPVRCVQPSRPTFPGSDHDAATPGCRHISRSAAGAAAPALLPPHTGARLSQPTAAPPPRVCRRQHNRSTHTPPSSCVPPRPPPLARQKQSDVACETRSRLEFPQR